MQKKICYILVKLLLQHPMTAERTYFLGKKKCKLQTKRKVVTGNKEINLKKKQQT